MQRSVRKNQRLQERLNNVKREMSRVENEIRATSELIDKPDRIKALRRLKQLSVEQESPREAMSERLLPREDLFEKPMSRPEPSGSQATGVEMDGTNYDTVIPKASADQRFVNYFVTGGLHSVRPLRQERRIQRNKAIVMAVIAAFVLYGVISMLF